MSTEEVYFLSKREFLQPAAENVKHLKEIENADVSFLPDGRINTDCTCLQSAFAHRCGYLMRKAIDCYNTSRKQPRGVECEDRFADHAICTGEDKEK